MPSDALPTGFTEGEGAGVMDGKAMAAGAGGRRQEGAPIAPGLPDTAAPEGGDADGFRAVLDQTGMTLAGLTRLLRRHGWRLSYQVTRGWAAEGGACRTPPPPELLAWLRGLAAHLRRDPLPVLPPPPPEDCRRPRRPPEELVDWLRRLVAYHHRNPPPGPAAAWQESARGRMPLH